MTCCPCGVKREGEVERRGLVKREHRFPGAGALHQLTLLWLERAAVLCTPFEVLSLRGWELEANA